MPASFRHRLWLPALGVGWLAGLLGRLALGPGPWWVVVLTGCGLLSLALARVASRIDSPHPLRTALILATLAAAAGAGLAVPPRLPAPAAGLSRLEARVISSRYGSGNRGSGVVEVLRGGRLSDGRSLAVGTRLWVGPEPLPQGAHVRLLAQVRALTPHRNPGPQLPPPPSSLHGVAWLKAPPRVLHPPPTLQHLLARLRAHIRRGLRHTLEAPYAGLARALTIGDAGAVDEGVRGAVRDAGLAHVLAVSGLHVAIVAGLWVGALRRLLLYTPLARRLDVRRLACGLGVPSCFAYAELVGGSPSAWRAALTASLSWAAVAAGRRPRTVAVLALAVLLLSAWRPRDVQGVGFWLSVVATAALVSAAQVEGRGLGGWLRRALSASWRTTLATAPIVWCAFGQLPVAGLLANVVVLPWASAALIPLANLHALSAALAGADAADAAWPWLSRWVFERVAQGFVAAAELLAKLSWGPWPPPTPAQAGSVVCAAVLLLALRDLRGKLGVLAGLVLVLGLLELRLRHVEQPEGQLRVTYVDVGQGDAALVDLPDGRLMLVDAGDPGQARRPHPVATLLRARRRARIDIAVLSHPHPDHYGGLGRLLGQLPIGELWDTGQARAEDPAGEVSALLDRARQLGTRVRGPETLCGATRYAGAARIQLLAPCPRYDPGYGANDNSLVVRIAHRSHRFLFTGDIEADAERLLLARGVDLRADVLKVAHHGSRTSSTQRFLQRVAPRLAVISAGQRNHFGHPHPEVLVRLHGLGIPTLRLDRRGGVIVRSEGEALTARAWDGTRLAL